MAEILLDSDVIIHWLRGSPSVSAAVVNLLAHGDSLLWTPVSVAEIFAGVRHAEEKQVETLFLVLGALNLTPEIGKRAGAYLHTYSRSHGVELADALIAASAEIHGMPLWTLNRKHYPMKTIRFFSPD